MGGTVGEIIKTHRGAPKTPGIGEVRTQGFLFGFDGFWDILPSST